MEGGPEESRTPVLATFFIQSFYMLVRAVDLNRYAAGLGLSSAWSIHLFNSKRQLGNPADILFTVYEEGLVTCCHFPTAPLKESPAGQLSREGEPGAVEGVGRIDNIAVAVCSLPRI